MGENQTSCGLGSPRLNKNSSAISGSGSVNPSRTTEIHSELKLQESLLYSLGDIIGMLEDRLSPVSMMVLEKDSCEEKRGDARTEIGVLIHKGNRTLEDFITRVANIISRLEI